MDKRGISPSSDPKPDLRWVREDEITWRLMNGRRTVAHAVDLGHPFDAASWHARCDETDISPGDMEASGISNDATLADAKMVAVAMATGDVGPLVLAAHSKEDCTDDMRLALTGLLALIAKSSMGSR